jgi:hypothetical protein
MVGRERQAGDERKRQAKACRQIEAKAGRSMQVDRQRQVGKAQAGMKGTSKEVSRRQR